MKKFNKEKDYLHKVYVAQHQKTMKNGSNSNTFIDRVLGEIFTSKKREVKAIDKAEVNAIKLKDKIRDKNQNIDKAKKKTGVYPKKRY